MHPSDVPDIRARELLTVMALAAWLVYWKLGLNLLRTAWFNLDWAWAGALLITGIIVLFK